ncbi:MAG: NAD(P)/FAD-dependent oxidoreductase [Bacillota bacterium]
MSRVIVIGGGPAGMLAAGRAAALGSQVWLLEKNERLGKKLVITGKGRCNVTNDADPDTLIKNIPGNGRFLYSAFAAFGSDDLQTLLQDHGVELKVERGNRVFPKSDRSFDVVDGLRRFLERNRVRVELGVQVDEIIAEAGAVVGVQAQGKLYPAEAAIICTGGASYPATGSTGDGYRLAERLGHTIVPPKPALVPLEVQESWAKELMGLTLKNVRLTLFQGGKQLGSEFGEMLFTHFGISGPTVLSLSRLVTHQRKKGDAPITAQIDLKPALRPEQLDQRLQRDFSKYQRKQLQNALDELLPKRLIPAVIDQSGVNPEKPVHQITREERQALQRTLNDLTLTITGTRPLSEAIVTAGGVSVKEINPKNMESKLVSGLFFAGEVIDIDGYTGGFNLQAAFSTGFLAGSNAASH